MVRRDALADQPEAWGCYVAAGNLSAPTELRFTGYKVKKNLTKELRIILLFNNAIAEVRV